MSEDRTPDYEGVDQRLAAAEALAAQFSGMRLYPTPAWSSDEMHEFLDKVEATGKHLVCFCAPARVDELRATVDRSGLGGSIDVVGHPLLGDNLTLFATSDRDMRELLAALQDRRHASGDAPGNPQEPTT